MVSGQCCPLIFPLVSCFFARHSCFHRCPESGGGLFAPPAPGTILLSFLDRFSCLWAGDDHAPPVAQPPPWAPGSGAGVLSSSGCILKAEPTVRWLQVMTKKWIRAP